MIGRAFLYACSPPEREAVLNQMKVKEPEMLRKYKPQIDKSLEDIRSKGYCVSTGDLRREVHAVGDGPIPPEVGRKLADRVRLQELTPREIEVLELLPKGLLRSGDVLGLVAGTKLTSGATNFMRLHTVAEAPKRRPSHRQNKS